MSSYPSQIRVATLRWDTEEEAAGAPQRIGDMLALIASSREYQFG